MMSSKLLTAVCFLALACSSSKGSLHLAKDAGRDQAGSPDGSPDLSTAAEVTPVALDGPAAAEVVREAPVVVDAPLASDVPMAADSPPGDGYGEAGRASSAVIVANVSMVNIGAADPAVGGTTTFRLANQGTASSGPVVAATASSWLVVSGCGGALAVGEFCTVTVTALPGTAGNLSGTISVSADPGLASPLLIPVFASTGGGTFSVSPTVVDLGVLQLGTVAPPIRITVAASGAISDLAVTTSGTDLSVDKTATTCTEALVPGAVCTVVVVLVADKAGVKSGSVEISGGGSNGKVVSVPITAVVQYPAKLVINPSAPQVFTAPIGQASSPVTFGIANSGDMPTGLITVVVTGAGARDFDVTSDCTILTSFRTCTAVVVFRPTVGEKNVAALNVIDTGPAGSSLSVPLSGEGSPGPALLITPSLSVDLGTVLVGTTGPSAVLSVSNPYGAVTGPLTIAVSSQEFVVSNDTCTGASLANGGKCTISVALAPASVGAKSAVLTVAAPEVGEAIKSLSGTGVSGPHLVVTSPPLAFGPVAIGSAASQTVTVSNSGGSPTDSIMLSLSGDPFFMFRSNTCSAPLPPGGTCTFTLDFMPTSTGLGRSTLTVSDGITQVMIAVTGFGV